MSLFQLLRPCQGDGTPHHMEIWSAASGQQRTARGRVQPRSPTRRTGCGGAPCHREECRTEQRPPHPSDHDGRMGRVPPARTWSEGRGRGRRRHASPPRRAWRRRPPRTRPTPPCGPGGPSAGPAPAPQPPPPCTRPAAPPAVSRGPRRVPTRRRPATATARNQPCPRCPPHPRPSLCTADEQTWQAARETTAAGQLPQSHRVAGIATAHAPKICTEKVSQHIHNVTSPLFVRSIDNLGWRVASLTNTNC